ncbi:hypothetical protein U1Q18_039504 [Sarracenia purpurea var. burkii]
MKVKMMMLKVIARTVGLHRLILLNFYPFLQRYIQVCHLMFHLCFELSFSCLSITRLHLQPHQRDVTNLLAAAVQACHDMVRTKSIVFFEALFKISRLFLDEFEFLPSEVVLVLIVGSRGGSFGIIDVTAPSSASSSSNAGGNMLTSNPLTAALTPICPEASSNLGRDLGT